VVAAFRNKATAAVFTSLRYKPAVLEKPIQQQVQRHSVETGQAHAECYQVYACVFAVLLIEC
jgi:hypothetical protein